MADLLSVVVGIRVVAIGTVSISVVGVSVAVGVVAVVSTVVSGLSIGISLTLVELGDAVGGNWGRDVLVGVGNSGADERSISIRSISSIGVEEVGGVSLSISAPLAVVVVPQTVAVGVVAIVSTIVASLSIGLRCSLGISAPLAVVVSVSTIRISISVSTVAIVVSQAIS